VTRTIAILCATVIALSTAALATASTAVEIFNPWAARALGRGFTVSGRAAGSCWTHSLSSDRPDAWRCLQGNDIHDPCFAQSRAPAVVACAESPFSKNVVLIQLKKPLSDGESATAKLLQPKGEPWGLRLTSGDRCVFVTGATDAVAGERLNYACGKTEWIIGAPDRSTGIWTARSVDWPNKRITNVRIATAIF
jgi:hypothetical protein